MTKKGVLIIALALASFIQIQAGAVEVDYYYSVARRALGLNDKKSDKNSEADKEVILRMVNLSVETNKALMEQKESVLLLANKLKEEETKRRMLEEQVKELKKTIEHLNVEQAKLAQENKALKERVEELEDRFNKLIELLSKNLKFKNLAGKVKQ